MTNLVSMAAKVGQFYLGHRVGIISMIVGITEASG